MRRLDARWPLAILAALAACASPTDGARDTGAGAAGAPSPEPSGPPSARWEIVRMLEEARDQPRHPADGGGRAWVEAGGATTAEPVAGRTGRFTIVYEAGPEGVAAGGTIFFQVSPFWGWSTPQVRDPGAPGYTTIETEPAALALEPETIDRQLLALRVGARPMAAGERVRIHYGAGPAGASVDRYAERGSRFWIAVDGDGDGVRAVLRDSPAVDVAPGPPARLVVTGPTVARPGVPVRLTLAVLDAAGNAGPAVTGPIVLQGLPAGASPPTIVLAAADRGRTTVTVTVREPGVLRLRATGPGGLDAESNPIVVSAEAPAVLWADLHGHSHLSDGTGTPGDYFTYARDVAALDVAALTDHDHWGMLPLDDDPAAWAAIRAAVARFHAPGRFVTLLGYEWTSWIYGHRHVLYFDDAGDVLSSLDPAYRSPPQLWRALAGRDALTFAHHSAGGPIPTDWTIAPDPVLEPVTEVVSVHGSSEAPDAPGRIYSAVAGNFVRDALDRGYRLGFVGSGDSHDGHPGLAHLAAPSGGLAAIVAETPTRAAVLAALRARRTYATNGPRMLLQAALDGEPMGSTLDTGGRGLATATLIARVVAAGRLARVDVVRSGAVVVSLTAEGTRETVVQRELTDLARGEYVYVRAVQTDGGAAWSSPFFIE